MIKFPASKEELAKIPDATLAALQHQLAMTAEQTRDARRVLAREAERRATLPKTKEAA